MNKFEQFYNATEEEKLKLIKAENPDADENSIKEHVETLNKFFEEVLHRRRATRKQPDTIITFATQDISPTHGQLEAIKTCKPIAFGIYHDDVSEDAKEVMEGIMRDVLRKLEKKEE